jgi:photosystem II stability/assembly factor-like uncharacterized protein
MKPQVGIVGRGLVAALVLLTSCLSLGVATVAAAPAGAAATASPWSPVSWPGGAAWDAHDAYAFGSTDLAVAGDGHVAITRDGGRTWQVRVPTGHAGTAFTAVAFTASGRGVVASGGLLLVTADWGVTWTTPVFVGPTPGAAINDVAMRGSRAVAVGDAGTVLSSTDSGVTWQLAASPTASALTSVAIAGDGTAVAGSPSGEILVGATTWTAAGTAPEPVTTVTASDAPVWGDGLPDLFVATGHAVLGSDDALVFAPLPGLPDLTSASWPAVAWTGLPERSLLVAGDLEAGFFGTSSSWAATSTGLHGLALATAPGGQSVAYLLGLDGRLVRTLSAGRDPAVVSVGRSLLVVGAGTKLTATVHVAAGGTAIVRTRVPGRAWTDLRRVAWTAADWNRRLTFAIKPSLTHDYQLQLKYGGTTTVLAPATRVIVAPRVTTTRSRYDLSVGAVFRFSGVVAPKLGGERVELFTDRGGGWRPVSLQRSVSLRDGRHWTSRRFGTPKAETYHLRAHLPRTRAHGEAWSRIVTVAIH